MGNVLDFLLGKAPEDSVEPGPAKIHTRDFPYAHGFLEIKNDNFWFYLGRTVTFHALALRLCPADSDDKAGFGGAARAGAFTGTIRRAQGDQEHCGVFFQDAGGRGTLLDIERDGLAHVILSTLRTRAIQAHRSAQIEE